MNANVSPRDQEIIEAYSVAKSAGEFARLLGVSIKTTQNYRYRLNLTALPHTGRIPHPRNPEACEMFKSGKTMTEIALALDMSRGQVAGIIGRAGLFKKRVLGQKRSTKPKIKQTNTNGIILRPKFRTEPFKVKISPAPFLGVSLMDRKFGQCAYPDPHNFDKHNPKFCGQPTSGDRPYCPACAQIMYQPPQSRHYAPRPR